MLIHGFNDKMQPIRIDEIKILDGEFKGFIELGTIPSEYGIKEPIWETYSGVDALRKAFNKGDFAERAKDKVEVLLEELECNNGVLRVGFNDEGKPRLIDEIKVLRGKFEGILEIYIRAPEHGIREPVVISYEGPQALREAFSKGDFVEEAKAKVEVFLEALENH